MHDGLPLGTLYLIEDFRGDVDHPITMSGYSSLYLLASELNWLKQTSIHEPLNELFGQDSVARNFALDPIGSLASIGAKVGPAQQIKAIYRLRAACVDSGCGGLSGRTTIGYPIVIYQGTI
jgi:hypothetical protein